MQREHKRKRHQRQIERHAVAVVPDQPRDEIEPQKVLARCAEARNLNGKIRADDAQKHEADREENCHREIERVELRGNRGRRFFALPDQPDNAQQQQRLVPDRRDDRNCQHIAQHVVDENVKPDGKEQNRRHAAGKQPAEDAAASPTGKNAAVNAVENGEFYPACAFSGQALVTAGKQAPCAAFVNLHRAGREAAVQKSGELAAFPADGNSAAHAAAVCHAGEPCKNRKRPPAEKAALQQVTHCLPPCRK